MTDSPSPSTDPLNRLLSQVADGSLSVETARNEILGRSFEDIGFANIDHNRTRRKGFPEVIFGQGKTAEQIIGIMARMIQRESIIMVTRINPDKASAVRAEFEDAVYHDDARLLLLKKKEPPVTGRGDILVISAGTSDIPVAQEAFLTAQAMGNRVEALFDVGVAGIHRLLAHHQRIQSADVVIVVAGMEGALPSVVAGMIQAPVIAVPTSIGYGANFGGISALLGMLNACASNVAVVNIDNGFGAGFMASSINHIGH